MISIVICSRKKTTTRELEINIAATIGIAYEIIVIDNSENRHSIFEAYNIGVKQSQFQYLCFMHDDIVYCNHNWGQAVTHHFSDENVAAIGIAGSPYYPYMPGPWWGSGIIYETILQSDKPEIEPNFKDNSNGLKKREAVVLDGVWMCIRKNIFDEIQFDAVGYKGFHLYDADICMQLHQKKYKIYCVNDVLIHHSSMGQLSNDWINSDLLFQKKWKDQLPAACISLSINQSCRLEFKVLNSFIWICSANNWPNSRIYRLASGYLSKFKKGYFFYKTPGYFVKFLLKMYFKKGAPFYLF